MADSPVINLYGLEQVCMVIRDVEKTMRDMHGVFGLGPWNVKTLSPGNLSHMTYHGKPSSYSFKFARTQNRPGSLEIELIQPLEGPSVFRDFLEERGEGIHHLGWHRVKTLEDFEEQSRSLEKAGYANLMSGGHNYARFAYFDTVKPFKTVLELIWFDTSIMPVYDSVFPVID
jgi:hypothetical protein